MPACVAVVAWRAFVRERPRLRPTLDLCARLDIASAPQKVESCEAFVGLVPERRGHWGSGRR